MGSVFSPAQGEVLILGCSHSLVDVITRTAKQHPTREVALVMGGYHLLPYDQEQIEVIARGMRDELGVGQVAPAHCTGPLAFNVFHELYGDDYLLAGLGSIVTIPR